MMTEMTIAVIVVSASCHHDNILFETRTGDEKDDNNSLQRFGVLHLLQREEMEGSVADLTLFLSL